MGKLKIHKKDNERRSFLKADFASVIAGAAVVAKAAKTKSATRPHEKPFPSLPDVTGNPLIRMQHELQRALKKPIKKGAGYSAPKSGQKSPTFSIGVAGTRTLINTKSLAACFPTNSGRW